MIVDDNRKMREMIKKVLNRYLKNINTIIECSDGREAVESYDKYMPDWTLMDIEMKPLNGLSATTEIISAHPQAKVIIVTQYKEPEFREAAKNAGACGYIFKENLIDIPNIIKEL